MILIGLSGVAGSGKDFFSSLCVDYFESLDLTVRTFSFANEVKISLDSFISENFGFSSFTEDRFQKEIIRPIMVSFAESMKKVNGSDYWRNKLFKEITKYTFSDVIIIKDVRFPVELSKIKELNGSVIHISRYKDIEGIRYFTPPANSVEEENDSLMSYNSDIKFHWPELTKSEAQQQVSTFLSDSNQITNKTCLIS